MFESQIAAALTKILSSNTEGALLVLSLITIAYLFRALIKTKDQANDKMSQTNVVLKAVNDTMKEVLIEIERNPNHEHKRQKRK